MNNNKLETCECIFEKCYCWKNKCSNEKRRIELKCEKEKKPIPEWICKWPYPGANAHLDDDDNKFLPKEMR